MTNIELLAAIRNNASTMPRACYLAARGHMQAIRILSAKVRDTTLGYDPLPIDWCAALAANLWAAAVQHELEWHTPIA